MTLTEVRVRDCACPNSPHSEGDLVYVKPKLSLAGGLAATADIQAALGNGSLLAELWLVTFVRHGAVGWNFTDEDGEPVPFDVEALLEDFEIARAVAETCDELYGETVASPLVDRIRRLSKRGPTNGSTSPTSEQTRKPRGRSSRRTSAASKR